MLNKFIKLSLISLLSTFSFAVNTVHAADAAAKFNCMLTDSTVAGDKPGPHKTDFLKTTPEIYLFCSSSNAKKGQTIKSVWIATDTNNVAPPNFEIDSKKLAITDDATDKHVLGTKFSLSKPDKGWPSGHYRVDLYINDELVQSIKYDIS